MKNNLLFQNKAREKIELDANQIAALCGNNSDRIFRLEAHLGLKPAPFPSWYAAAVAVAKHLNAGSDRPAENLQYILSEISE